MSFDADVIIVGAGLAGLSCAHVLQKQGIHYLLLDGAEKVGGRIRTDVVDGFQLDRGFQVLQTAYPDAKQILSYPDLKLKRFFPGAMIRYQDKFHRLADPFRDLYTAAKGLFSPIGSLKDKLLVGMLRTQVAFETIEKLLQKPEVTTLQRLKTFGFSDSIIDRFFKPLYSGIFLENELSTSSRAFDYNFRMMALGDICLPAEGMEAIPRQLLTMLDTARIRLNCKVAPLSENKVILASGETLTAPKIVLAVDQTQACKLLEVPVVPKMKTVSTLYFAASKAPTATPILFLDAQSSGPVMNMCVPTNVCKSYAPEGKALISCSVLKQDFASEEMLVQKVLEQMKQWFGNEVDTWKHLRTYKIINALPAQEPPLSDVSSKPMQIRSGVYKCGDYGGIASIQTALQSGRVLGEALAQGI
ncbi:MAG: NAD(P)/FAD-dependent oxidoreductase [Planctomycetota bacterium]|nr:NAD(P)/FAD-dependent oxidoreductase [Planctomycetota bacterium]